MPRSILVVDDNVIIRNALVAVLGSRGYEVFEASDGSAALAAARQNPVDLLITDLVMPEQEGIETIQHFVQEFPEMPIVAISGKAEYLPIARVLGAAAVLKKPFSHADLLKVVRDLIG